ncbi:hypothetical protein [Bacillus sp. AG4(2022)]|uniref:hypothetical protein n=1 Tax=Bacillus sp. AG4(2022) TaxID=2962594 RepID=UPI002881F7FE|nr:hypothetical protein [Bacillus sp. AG4(2022)]MDT0161865.1 hypothetical protein [Bacillus sp. AG4(2022)]
MRIPKRSQQYYIVNKVTMKGTTLQDGSIYELSADDAASLGSTAQEVSFPRLDAIRQDLDKEAMHYREKYAETEAHSRYASNPAEREFQLSELTFELDSKAAAALEKYTEEIRLYEKELLQKSMELPAVSEQERSQAQGAISMAANGAAMGNGVQALQLLIGQLQAMTPGQQAHIAQNFAAIRSAADPADRETSELLSQAYKIASSSLKGLQEYQTKSRHLDALKRQLAMSGSPSVTYKRLGLVHKGYRKFAGGR